MARTPVSAIAQYAPCTIYVRGQVTFSRIASHVEGDELARQNQEAAAKGRMPHAKPYTSISIKNPTIVDNGKLAPQVKQVIQERFYTKQDGTLMFSQESKSPFLPTVVYSTLAGELAGQGIADKNVPLPAELATGLDVTIGVSLFSKNGFAGLGMNYVLVNEPIRYFSSSALANDFADAGIAYKPPVQQATAPVQAATSVAAAVPEMPVQQAYVPPVQQPVMTQQATAPWETDTPFPAQPAQSVDQQTVTQAQRPVRYY